MNNEELARAFSGHRFEETVDSLADDVVWNLVGEARLEGPSAVVDACRGTAAENENVTTTWLRASVGGAGRIAARRCRFSGATQRDQRERSGTS